MTPEKRVEKTKKFYSTEGIPEEMKQALSFMRQWLNEDRKATPMVTARDLWHWLEKDYNNALIQYHQDLMSEVVEAERDRIFSCIEGLKTAKPYRSWLTTEYTNYKNILDMVQEELTQPNNPN